MYCFMDTEKDEGYDITDICIVGGGIGGLAAALALQTQCPYYKVRVYERDMLMNDRKQGYGLTLTNNKTGPLAQLGLLDECVRCNSSCSSSCHYTFDQEGNVLGYFGRSIKSKFSETRDRRPEQQQGGNIGNLRIPRQYLRKMILQKLNPDSVVWGRKFCNFIEREDWVEVEFYANGVVEKLRTKVLVGADGIKSAVRSAIDERRKQTSSLKYCGISVIIGLTASRNPHPLVNNRGFYVVNGTHRLFTMPFEKRRAAVGCAASLFPRDQLSSLPTSSSESSSGLSSSPSIESDESKAEGVEEYLTMWQLSFAGLSEEEAALLKSSSGKALLQRALAMTEGWFSAVRELLENTLEGDIWATGLFDRDPMPLKGRDQGSRVTCLGDACHPMSMFKGQGANQALEDGPLLARWLSPDAPGAKRGRSVSAGEGGGDADADVDAEGRERRRGQRLLEGPAVRTRLRCFEREAVGRSASKVLASREVALYLHSSQVLLDAKQQPSIEGVADARQIQGKLGVSLWDVLKEAGVHADLGDKLDDALIRAVEPFLSININ